MSVFQKINLYRER
ncbi:hypothetical protein F383_36958 [Gossypium arboreum]|uniref:Uncharacterized protein n=1 Tax=Gossypium arboreum TaxID=29729 RepID=A0A0B0M752_GOSAR|nr:hypothetical protein F383_36958 [Gossypium arboreum]